MWHGIRIKGGRGLRVRHDQETVEETAYDLHSKEYKLEFCSTSRKAKLIKEATVQAMRPGSVIVDLAVEQGGNVEGSEAGTVVVKHGVRIVGLVNLPGMLAADASALYARNLLNFFNPFNQLTPTPQSSTSRNSA